MLNTLAREGKTAKPIVNLHLGVVAGGDHDPGRGAPLPDGEGDVGSGHRAGEHQHPHLYYILYCTVLYVLVLQKVPSEANPKVRNHGEGPY